MLCYVFYLISSQICECHCQFADSVMPDCQCQWKLLLAGGKSTAPVLVVVSLLLLAGGDSTAPVLVLVSLLLLAGGESTAQFW